MYLEYFGLRERPFHITPDPRFFYPSAVSQEAYAGLAYSLKERKGFAILTGEVGTGKTTLLRRLMMNLSEEAQYSFVYNTTWNFDEVLDAICLDFALATPKGARNFDKIQVLNAFLLDQFKGGKTAALLIDEAHNLSVDVIENLRLLSNLETGSEKLLQIILVGQDELEGKLRQPLLRPLRDRVAIWGRLDRLKERDVGPFIQHRLRTAGCQEQEIFLPDAIQLVARYSQGSPRRINIICDNALLTAYGTYQKQVSAEIIEEVARDLGLLDDRRSGSQEPEVVTPTISTVSHATPPPVEDYSRIWTDTPLPLVKPRETIEEAEHGDRDNHVVFSQPQRYEGVHIAALALLLLCLLSILFFRAAGRSPQIISDATASLGSLFNEWSSPLRPQVEAKSLERAALPEKYGRPPERGLEGSNADIKSIPQASSSLNTAPAPPLQSTSKQESADKRALVAATSPSLLGTKEHVGQTIQERLEAPKLQTRETNKPPGDFRPRGQLITIPSGATILDLVSQIYGEKNLLALDMVKEYNPHVRNFDHILAGESLWMPALNQDTLFRQQADGSYHLIVASFRRRKEADHWARAALGGRYSAVIQRQEISMTTRLYRVVIEGLQDRVALDQAWQFLNPHGMVTDSSSLDKKDTGSHSRQLQASPLS